MFVCLALLTGGVANAAAPCCCMEKAKMQMQTGDMPCHDKIDHQKSSPMNCTGCGCMHGAQANLLSLPLLVKDRPAEHARVREGETLVPYRPEGLLQPPKYVS